MATQRECMVADQLARRGIRDPRVLEAFARIPRDAFVDPAQGPHAYDDAPLAIGFGQTISQPYIVALTAEALALRGDERVLDIGTGSGYAAAVLGSLAREVHTVERIPELASSAAERLARLGFANVHVHHGDGTLGWPIAAPYDAIAVGATAPRLPPPLLAQLAVGGRMVAPIGGDLEQRLLRVVRRDATTYTEDSLGQVRFVPLIGSDGW
jgi:protein-L-isoaspartate(D-aspartate) O-methyltransferase